MAGQSKTTMKANVAGLINDNTSGDITPADVRNALSILIDNLENLVAEEIVIVKSTADLPTPSAGKHVLDKRAYLIAAPISISNTLAPSVDCAIFGFSPLQAQITYTGTSNFFECSDTALSLTNVRFELGTSGGTFMSFANPTDEFNNFIIKDCLFLGNDNGPFGTISNPFSCFLSNSQFIGMTDGALISGTISSVTAQFCRFDTDGTMIDLDSSTIDTSRLTGNTFVVGVGATAIARNAATVADAIWSNNIFQGGGTYLSGVNHTFPTVWFDGNRGIENSAVLGSYVMAGNAVATDIVTAGVPVKVAGTSTVEKVERMTHSNNRLTWTAQEDGTLSVSLTVQMAKVGGGTQDYRLHIYKNGAALPVAVNKTVTDLTNNGASVTLFAQVDMSENDYVEPWIEGVGGNSDCLVSNASMMTNAL